LGLLGLVLERVFSLRNPLLIVGLLILMTVFAAREAVSRATRRYRGILVDAWLTMAVSCFAVGGIVTSLVVGVEPWYEPQYVIPLLGMILGNSLTGIALGLDSFLDHLDVRSAEVELRLAFGATRHEALAAPLRDAIRTGMIPIINSMAAAGIVSLPGMMTGQILAGSPPMQAVAYQIVVMFMLAAAVAFGAMLVVVLAGRHFMGTDATLRLDRMVKRAI
jgi:putative ABC transport system permease protein